MIVHRSYKYAQKGQISIPRDASLTKKQQSAEITAETGVIPRYSGKTGKFYIHPK